MYFYVVSYFLDGCHKMKQYRVLYTISPIKRAQIVLIIKSYTDNNWYAINTKNGQYNKK